MGKVKMSQQLYLTGEFECLNCKSKFTLGIPICEHTVDAIAEDCHTHLDPNFCPGCGIKMEETEEAAQA